MDPENENLEEGDVTAAVSSLMQELPKPVQDFLKSEERDALVRELSAKYDLHVDQAGEFERAFIFMLLGIMKPDEFARTLSQMGLTSEAVNALTSEVNTRVFMRLRDAEREASRTPTATQKPQPLPPPALEYEPAPTLPGSPVAAPMRVVGTPTPSYSVPAAPVPDPAPAPQQQVIHAMPNAAQPGWHPAAAVHIFVPTHGAHMQPTQAHPAPVSEPVVAEPIAPVAAVPIETGYVNPEPAPSTAPTPITKAYVADPYREPTD